MNIVLVFFGPKNITFHNILTQKCRTYLPVCVCAECPPPLGTCYPTFFVVSVDVRKLQYEMRHLYCVVFHGYFTCVEKQLLNLKARLSKADFNGNVVHAAPQIRLAFYYERVQLPKKRKPYQASAREMLPC